MIRRISFYITILMFALHSSCIDEITIAIPDFERQLVIEGWYGNQQAQNYVRVYYSSPFISGIRSPQYTAAPVDQVYVEDDEGRQIYFRRVQDYTYATNDYFPVEAGKQYRLVVSLTTGETYQSEYEVMPPLVEISDITASAYEALYSISTEGSSFTQIRTFASVKATITDPGHGELGYFFRTSGISEDYTFSMNDNCACTCYTSNPNVFNKMNLLDNEPFIDRTFQQTIADIPLYSLGRYFVETNMRTVSKENLSYLQQVDLQQKSTGSIFDPAPFRIRGNISKSDDPSRFVLGNFFVYQESRFDALLSRTAIRLASVELQHYIEPLQEVTIDCTEVFLDATSIPPAPFRR